jgi:nitronate monooxygenase
MGVTLSTSDTSELFSNDDEELTRSMELTRRAKGFLSLLHLKYPIVQAPAAGAAGPDLVIAVASAGALGGLPLTWASPEEAYELVQKVQSATHGSFFVNYVLNFEPKSLDKALEAGATTVQFSWGMPSKETLAKIRKAGAKLGIQVTSRESAKAALDMEADYLVCQGMEAGGHVHASRSLVEALEEVLDVAGDKPVLASGGLTTGHDIRGVISLGAAGAVLGTRFVATKESVAHPDYKQALLEADASDTVFTVCLNKGWPNATHRILRNQTFTMWEAAGCPQPGSRPGEHDIVARNSEGREYERYIISPPTVGMTGDVLDLGMYAGTGVRHINDLPSASALVVRLWREYEDEGDLETTTSP